MQNAISLTVDGVFLLNINEKGFPFGKPFLYNLGLVVGQSLLGLFVEDVQFACVNSDLNGVANFSRYEQHGR